MSRPLLPVLPGLLSLSLLACAPDVDLTASPGSPGGKADSIEPTDVPVYQREVTRGEARRVGDISTTTRETLVRTAAPEASGARYRLERHIEEWELVFVDRWENIEDWELVDERAEEVLYESCMAWSDVGAPVQNAVANPFLTPRTNVLCTDVVGPGPESYAQRFRRHEPASDLLPEQLPTLHVSDLHERFAAITCRESDGESDVHGAMLFVLDGASCDSSTELCGHLATSQSAAGRTRVEVSDGFARSETYGYYFYADADDRDHPGNYEACDVSVSADELATVSCTDPALPGYAESFPLEFCEFRPFDDERVGQPAFPANIVSDLVPQL